MDIYLFMNSKVGAVRAACFSLQGMLDQSVHAS